MHVLIRKQGELKIHYVIHAQLFIGLKQCDKKFIRHYDLLIIIKQFDNNELFIH